MNINILNHDHKPVSLPLDHVLDAVRDYITESMTRGAALTSPAHTREHLVHYFAGLTNESFAVVFLDNRHRVINLETLFHGTIDGTSVYPRVVAQRALQNNAATVILAHNHPSGVAEPSRADEVITRRLIDALGTFDIRVLDHIIVAGRDTVSMAERGLI